MKMANNNNNNINNNNNNNNNNNRNNNNNNISNNSNKNAVRFIMLCFLPRLFCQEFYDITGEFPHHLFNKYDSYFNDHYICNYIVMIIFVITL